MSTSKIASVQTLENAFLRRLGAKKDDATVAALAEELLEESRQSTQGNRSGEATYRTVAAAEEAMWMLRQFESQMKAFPQTRKVLWGSIVEGWLADPIGLIQEKEKDFARFLAGAEEDDCLEFLLGRIRQGLDSINNVLARKKVVQFLHYRAAEDNDRVVSAVSKTLGRYMTLDQLVFVSHVLERIEGNGQTPLALQLTAPVVAKQAERAMQTSATLSDLCREYESVDRFRRPDCVEVRAIGSVVIVWKMGTNLGVLSDDLKKDAERHLEKMAEIAIHWKEKHQTHPSLSVELVREVVLHGSGSDKPVVLTKTIKLK